MNIEQLTNFLRPWVQVDTWHTNHPCDDKRFHEAVKNAIDSYPESCLSYEDYKEAIESLVNEIYPEKYESTFIEDKIDKYSERADTISSYVFDTKKLEGERLSSAIFAPSRFINK